MKQHENYSEVYATFEVVEQLKGTAPFEHLTTSSSYMNGGIPLVIGGEYLIFTSDTGRIGSRSSILIVGSLPVLGEVAGITHAGNLGDAMIQMRSCMGDQAAKE